MTTQSPDTILVNPLGNALNHYETVLVDYLEGVGDSVALISFDEPSHAGGRRLRWIGRYSRALFRASRARPRRVIVAWPVMGYLDSLLIRLLLRRQTTFVVVHDPEPLVRSIGYSAFSRRLASVGVLQLDVIVHSSVARECLQRQAKVRSCWELPLPIAMTHEGPRQQSDNPTVRVLGRYKVGRDIGALTAIARSGFDGTTFEIVGRGWPAIDGWSVRSEFVDERRFTDLLRSSSVVVIPYRRFFQSEVAIRALECGTPFVGPADSSLADLLGHTHLWLASGPDDWPRAVQAALTSEPSAVAELCNRLNHAASTAWASWLSKN